jgi:hypothetical protein
MGAFWSVLGAAVTLKREDRLRAKDFLGPVIVQTAEERLYDKSSSAEQGGYISTVRRIVNPIVRNMTSEFNGSVVATVIKHNR